MNLLGHGQPSCSWKRMARPSASQFFSWKAMPIKRKPLLDYRVQVVSWLRTIRSPPQPGACSQFFFLRVMHCACRDLTFPKDLSISKSEDVHALPFPRRMCLSQDRGQSRICQPKSALHIFGACFFFFLVLTIGPEYRRFTLVLA